MSLDSGDFMSLDSGDFMSLDSGDYLWLAYRSLADVTSQVYLYYWSTHA
jgi:hypothetical protein